MGPSLGCHEKSDITKLAQTHDEIFQVSLQPSLSQGLECSLCNLFASFMCLFRSFNIIS